MGDSKRENGEPKYEYLSQVPAIQKSRDVLIASRNKIAEIVESPLVEACKILYDKNIRTIWTSANTRNIEEKDTSAISIDFDDLSSENQQIAVENGFDIYHHPHTGKKTLNFKIPADESTTCEEFSKKAIEFANLFKKQPPREELIPRYTIRELNEMYCTESDNPSDFEHTWYYDPQSQLFFRSREHFEKFNEKI